MITGESPLRYPAPPSPHYYSVRCSYIDTYSSILPHSEREFPIRGLNLIRLLIQNRIADFHTTLESLPLPADELIANPFIRHPVNLERWLMEGSYSKVWNAREEAPAEEYKFFVDSLMGTIRFVFFLLLFPSSGIGSLKIDVTGTRLQAVKRRHTRACRSRTRRRFFSLGHNQKYWILLNRCVPKDLRMSVMR